MSEDRIACTALITIFIFVPLIISGSILLSEGCDDSLGISCNVEKIQCTIFNYTIEQQLCSSNSIPYDCYELYIYCNNDNYKKNTISMYCGGSVGIFLSEYFASVYFDTQYKINEVLTVYAIKDSSYCYIDSTTIYKHFYNARIGFALLMTSCAIAILLIIWFYNDKTNDNNTKTKNFQERRRIAEEQLRVVQERTENEQRIAQEKAQERAQEYAQRVTQEIIENEQRMAEERKDIIRQKQIKEYEQRQNLLSNSPEKEKIRQITYRNYLERKTQEEKLIQAERQL